MSDSKESARLAAEWCASKRYSATAVLGNALCLRAVRGHKDEPIDNTHYERTLEVLDPEERKRFDELQKQLYEFLDSLPPNVELAAGRGHEPCSKRVLAPVLFSSGI
jgi:hypothetical protein